MIVKNDIYFFSLIKKGQDMTVNLNSFEIKKDALLAANTVKIKKQISRVKPEIEGAQLMGVTFIKGLEDEGHDVISEDKEPEFFFALIYGKHDVDEDGKKYH